jgi:hypothetical protein
MQMRKLTILGAALAVLAVTPATAQIGPGSPGGLEPDYNNGYYNNGYNNNRYYNNGYYNNYGQRNFWPDQVPGDVVGGAVGTAGAIATAPFRVLGATNPDTMAQAPDSYCAQRFRSYDPASGTYMGYDGQRHPCP